VFASLLVSVAAGVEPAQPKAVEIESSQGKALVSLARQAMHEYLRSRTPADKQIIPPDLEPLAKTKYASAVTLRSQGDVKAKVVQTGDSLLRNVIAAALKAMRSSSLPDRVTASVLDALTVEVEVIGPTVEVGEGDLAKLVRPGLTGVMSSRDTSSAYVLPSEAYEHSLDAKGVKTEALGLLGTPPKRWAIFAARHFAGYPGGRTVELYRGKLVPQPREVDEKLLVVAAEAIARHMIAHQGSDGLYGTAAGPAGSLLEHLHATYAMSLLARRSPDVDVSRSINAALSYVVKWLAQDARRAYVATENPDERPAATAWLVLILAEQPDRPEIRQLRSKLLAALKDAFGSGEALAPQVGAEPPKPKRKPPLKDTCLGYVALKLALPEDDSFAKDKLPGILESIVTSAKIGTNFPSGGGPASAVDAAWVGQALTAARFGPNAGYASTSAKLSAWLESRLGKEPLPPDEAGGIVEGNAVSTAATALSATMIAQASRQWSSQAAADRQQAKALAAKLQVFCYRMMFKPGEAFFAAKPDAWVGAVRAGPDASAVTVEACAAALEAFLAAQ